jgi:DNA polymerase-3 subunit gamma/tau
VVKTLTNAIKLGRVSHAYLFAGPRGTGKTTIARLLAKSLGCNDLDLIEIDAASNRGIDEIRELRDGIKFAPTAGKYKVFIIDEVHQLTKEAFNALLKTLEEPRGNALIILLATDASSLPETILSRCQQIAFGTVPEGEIAAGLVSLGVEETKANEYAQASRGLPGLALTWAADPALFAAHEAERALLRGLWGEPLYKKRAAMEGMLGDAPSRDRLFYTLGLWEWEVRDALLGAVPAKNPAALVSAAHAIRDVRTWLGENVSTKLLVEHVLLAIP